MREANRRARIAHITSAHRPFDPRIFYKQLGTLREAGFRAHLIAPHDRAEQREGIRVHPLPEGRRSWGARLALQPGIFRRARKLEARLYQIHDPELIPVAYLLKKATGARIVYDMHENYRTKGPLWGRVLRTLERWCFRWVDHVLLAETSYRPIVDGHAVPSTCILNYYVPIGEEEPPEPAPARTPTRLLYTGTVSDDRGLRTMLDLAAAVRKGGRPERLDVVGVCNLAEQRRSAERRMQRDELGRVVRWVGRDRYVPPADMTPYYRRADVGLWLAEPTPNLAASVPTKFYEYLHYGLPILCTDAPLWRRFVEENECGAVVPSGEVEPILDVLERWRTQPDVYRQYARNARAAAPRYRWKRMGRRLVRVYRDLLGSSGEREAESRGEAAEEDL